MKSMRIVTLPRYPARGAAWTVRSTVPRDRSSRAPGDPGDLPVSAADGEASITPAFDSGQVLIHTGPVYGGQTPIRSRFSRRPTCRSSRSPLPRPPDDAFRRSLLAYGSRSSRGRADRDRGGPSRRDSRRGAVRAPRRRSVRGLNRALSGVRLLALATKSGFQGFHNWVEREQVALHV